MECVCSRERSFQNDRFAFNGAFAAQAKYLHKLLDLTYTHTLGFRAEETWADLGRPTMTIEDYAASIARTAGRPKT